jgi:DNA helicase-2/ATP-dependent DNA helicase PcrA
MLRSCEGGSSPNEAAVSVRERSRLIGRPLAKRTVGSTLLLKGLEAEVSVVLNTEGMDAANFYVAATRGSTKLVICSADRMLP